ncbi:MAG: hypothetical protein HOH65_00910 [Rhodospirillaceae bacterium]|nr:hypothetical protein [Rhodospirillaceae bacterium]
MVQIAASDLSFIGRGLSRPECVVATRAGELFVSDARGGIASLRGDDEPELILATSGDIPDGFLPNGYSLMPNGDFLIANVASGGVYTLKRDGTLVPFLLEVDGRPLVATNFANRDEQGRVWISISTWQEDRDKSFRSDVADGSIILVDERGARVVADGIGFTNENKVDPSGRWVYVHETMARRLSRFEIRDGNALGPRETVVEYGAGNYADGFEFDAEGGVWATMVVSNRVLRVAPDGEVSVVLDCGDPDVVAAAEAAFLSHTYNREYLNAGKHSVLGNCASIGFGGPDLKTVYIGSLFNDKVTTFRSPIAGAVPPHWEF